MRIERNRYLNQLKSARHNGLVKVITGLRRCGKSYLLFTLFHDFLLNEGVEENHIIEIALDDLDNLELRNPQSLLSYVRSRLVDGKMHYVILDEIQLVPNFVEVLNSLLHDRNVDVYVTGSNSRLLSSDIATEFRGRSFVIQLYPLTFSEFLPAYDGDKDDAWEEYYTYGGLPLVMNIDGDKGKSDYLSNLYETV